MKNYTLVEEKYIEYEKSHAYVYEHDHTKAKVFILKNDDSNKLFSVGFRTPPKDSTGVCHILEHCVLNGSKKYRTREPFMDMVKGSLYTFLNAMTYFDKTLYPVASRNTKDFENLMDVYLDAVFAPRVLEKEEIFLQEGWRYHLDENEELTYKGVVYNEMRGALSSAEDQIYQQIYHYLLKDTIYTHESGGDPYEIPNLTYEAFIDYYKEFYHPSNSYIFLYGDVDHERYLDYIHEEYLKNYDFRQVDSKISGQPTYSKPIKIEAKYSTGKVEDDKSNYVSYNIILGDNDSAYDRIMSEILVTALNVSESSPLKNRINSLDIVEDLIDMSGNYKQNIYSILAKNISRENVDTLIDNIEDCLKEIAEKGLDEDVIKSVINKVYFSIKEKYNYATKGIVYMSQAFSSWLYDQSPIEGVDISDDLRFIEENLDKGIVEKFVKEHFVENPNKAIIVHVPEEGLNAKRDEEVKRKLAEYKASLSDEDLKAIKDMNARMEDFQSKEDSPEDKATLPKLQLADIKEKFNKIDRKVEDRKGYTLVTHELPTSGIDYLMFSFDLSHLDREEYKYASVLTSIVGMMATEKLDHNEVNNKQFLETGGIFLDLAQYKDIKTKKVNRRLNLHTKILSNNVKNAFEILDEVAFRTVFTDEKRFKDLLNMLYSRLELSLYDSAHSLMMTRALSHTSDYENFVDLTAGVDFFLFVKELLKKDVKETLDKLKDIYSRLYSGRDLAVNITSSFENKDELIKAVDDFLAKDLPVFEAKEYIMDKKIIKEAFKSSADVNYVCRGANFDDGFEYKGRFAVLKNIVSNNYLYNEIRAKGGAYGAGMGMNDANNVFTFSYRDPNLQRTLGIYDKVGDFVRDLDLSDEDLLPFIIGAIGGFDPAMSDKAKGEFDFRMYMAGKSYDDLEAYVEDCKKVTLEDLKVEADTLDRLLKETSLAVLGNSATIEENKDLFDRIIDLA